MFVYIVGCGSRDLEEAVGGITTLQALDLLAGDPATEPFAVPATKTRPAFAR